MPLVKGDRIIDKVPRLNPQDFLDTPTRFIIDKGFKADPLRDLALMLSPILVLLVAI